jgi:hypothetical protein
MTYLSTLAPREAMGAGWRFFHIGRVAIEPEKEKQPGGQHNPLKRPDPDKRIQGIPSPFL